MKQPFKKIKNKQDPAQTNQSANLKRKKTAKLFKSTSEKQLIHKNYP